MRADVGEQRSGSGGCPRRPRRPPSAAPRPRGGRGRPGSRWGSPPRTAFPAPARRSCGRAPGRVERALEELEGRRPRRSRSRPARRSGCRRRARRGAGPSRWRPPRRGAPSAGRPISSGPSVPGIGPAPDLHEAEDGAVPADEVHLPAPGGVVAVEHDVAPAPQPGLRPPLGVPPLLPRARQGGASRRDPPPPGTRGRSTRGRSAVPWPPASGPAPATRREPSGRTAKASSTTAIDFPAASPCSTKATLSTAKQTSRSAGPSVTTGTSLPPACTWRLPRSSTKKLASRWPESAGSICRTRGWIARSAAPWVSPRSDGGPLHERPEELPSRLRRHRLRHRHLAEGLERPGLHLALQPGDLLLQRVHVPHEPAALAGELPLQRPNLLLDRHPLGLGVLGLGARLPGLESGLGLRQGRAGLPGPARAGPRARRGSPPRRRRWRPGRRRSPAPRVSMAFRSRSASQRGPPAACSDPSARPPSGAPRSADQPVAGMASERQRRGGPVTRPARRASAPTPSPATNPGCRSSGRRAVRRARPPAPPAPRPPCASASSRRAVALARGGQPRGRVAEAAQGGLALRGTPPPRPGRPGASPSPAPRT